MQECAKVADVADVKKLLLFSLCDTKEWSSHHLEPDWKLLSPKASLLMVAMVHSSRLPADETPLLVLGSWSPR